MRSIAILILAAVAFATPVPELKGSILGEYVKSMYTHILADVVLANGNIKLQDSKKTFCDETIQDAGITQKDCDDIAVATFKKFGLQPNAIEFSEDTLGKLLKPGLGNQRTTTGVKPTTTTTTQTKTTPVQNKAPVKKWPTVGGPKNN
jgi:hypothetical protein